MTSNINLIQAARILSMATEYLEETFEEQLIHKWLREATAYVERALNEDQPTPQLDHGLPIRNE